MLSFGSQMRKRLEELRRAGQNVPQIMIDVAEEATIAAVDTATQNTPPNGAEIAGTNTRSGQMADRWELDSQTAPTYVDGSVRTYLANNMQYASYVNDGHRMDKHFVPGLIVNGELLEKVGPEEGGIVVGTKKTYVKGLYMKQKAVGTYRDTVRKELAKRVEEAFK